ncbi:fumarylacetoacetate hydrolase family protein [Variovorax sp. JS1663]|uniref:fumarylacetoacetate hydrolase family protein n=1 Tax=Variovorax sp. JS1663 TaxID=1851577 RepID=UPI000B347464|nr:fumarylacetoacetate hydrolase family protein [Variovorax sp. JS1663]OUM01576.1 5-carboxymethyl-2-hydroxymuconate isomerase [Variovorax sp. JS1663]
MNAYVLPAPAATAVPVSGSGLLFPVRRVYCVGRNYAAHAREMGFSDREPPFFFCKPTDAIVPVPDGAAIEIPYPARTGDFQHEIELVVAIGRAGSDIAAGDALDHVFGYAVGLDMTRRDLQIRMREQGRPWEIGKSFDGSALIGPIRPVALGGHPSRARIRLDVDGQLRQDSDIGELVWNVAETIAHLSGWFELRPGDLIYTGTPAGVGPVHAGQTMVGAVEGLGELRVRVGSGP